MSEPIKQTIVIPSEHGGLRLDRSLAKLFPEYSRARLQDWISSQRVTVDGQFQANRYTVAGGERVELTPVEEDEKRHTLQARFRGMKGVPEAGFGRPQQQAGKMMAVVEVERDRFYGDESRFGRESINN